jgi:hypothetical protein
MSKQKTYPRYRTSPLLMGDGSSRPGQPKKPLKVIDGDRLMEYVGIGWIEIRQATAKDRQRYPTLTD